MSTAQPLILAGESPEPRQTQTAARALAPVRDTPPTPAEMLDAAVRSGASIETMEKLIALQERWEANNARKAFDAAISDAKEKIKPIVKNKQGHSGAYADFSAITASVDPILSEHGLSYRFRTEQNDRIVVTCILSHRDGHSEQTTLSGPPDTSGSKNAVQSIGSTAKYLMRYTLTLAIGIATTENDDDGRSPSGGTISPEQIEKLRREVMDADADLPEFLKYFRVEKLDDLPANQFDRAMSALKRKKATAK